jgi:hypothetical protein
MGIDTTLHLHNDTMKIFLKASRLTGQTKRQLFSRLLSIIADEQMIDPVAWSRIRYQVRDQKTTWHRMHISLTPAEYELFIDLRKVYKMSASRIIALAMEKFMERLINSSGKETDNYRISSYVFSGFTMDGVICWAQYWGLPRKLHSFPDLPIPIKNTIPLRGS